MRHGFSLVELSIVLVILGLLTGGILAGQSLVRASELRAVSTELNRYNTAVQAFREKYFSLPGDMPNAVQFWGAADGGDGVGNDCYLAVSSTQATCNGNGDGYVTSNATTFGNEMFRFWQQLANAGLIEGSYTGAASIVATPSRASLIGSNTPRSKFSNMGYTIERWGRLSAQPYTWDGDYGHVLQFGGQESPNDLYEVAVFKPEEMWNIDSKMDDGKPGTGKFRTYITTGCANDSNPANFATADYLLSNLSTTCFGTYSGGF